MLYLLNYEIKYLLLFFNFAESACGPFHFRVARMSKFQTYLLIPNHGYLERGYPKVFRK